MTGGDLLIGDCRPDAERGVRLDAAYRRYLAVVDALAEIPA